MNSHDAELIIQIFKNKNGVTTNPITMKLVARISRKCDLKSYNDVSDWRWHFYKTDWKPIDYAAYKGNIKIVRHLHENGADIQHAHLHASLDANKYFEAYEKNKNIAVAPTKTCYKSHYEISCAYFKPIS